MRLFHTFTGMHDPMPFSPLCLDPDFTHDRLQSECFQWFHNTYPLLRKLMWHTANEAAPYKGETQGEYLRRLNRRKAIGVVNGVFDLVLYYRNTLYGFDIKVGRDQLSTDQKQFNIMVTQHGGTCYVVRSLEQFKEIIQKILS